MFNEEDQREMIAIVFLIVHLAVYLLGGMLYGGFIQCLRVNSFIFLKKFKKKNER